jgi:hypothetical protein
MSLSTWRPSVARTHEGPGPSSPCQAAELTVCASYLYVCSSAVRTREQSRRATVLLAVTPSSTEAATPLYRAHRGAAPHKFLALCSYAGAYLLCSNFELLGRSTQSLLVTSSVVPGTDSFLCRPSRIGADSVSPSRTTNVLLRYTLVAKQTDSAKAIPLQWRACFCLQLRDRD